MKKICLIAPSLQMGGIERAMSTLANYFVTQGIEVFYVAMFPFECFFRLDKRIKYFQPETSYPKGGNVFKLLDYYRRVFSPCQGYLVRTLKEIKPDVVMSFGDWYPHLAMLALKGRYPFYYANRSNPLIRYSWGIELLRKLAYRLYPPVGIIAQTSLAKERKEKIFGRSLPKIQVIPNPARLVRHYDVPRKNYIIAVGRVLRSKGFGRVIDVFARLDASDWRLILVGDGPAMNEMRAKVDALNLSDRVVFTGKSDNVDEWLAKAKIYLMASYREGFPNALCEAMAAGLACVSYDIVAGPRDIINDGVDGYLVADGNEDLMVEKAQYLIDQPDVLKMMGKNAERIVDRLSIDRIGKMYLNFLFDGK